MPGTIEGGQLAAKTNKERYGQDFYKRIGAIGGNLGHTGGFATEIPCDCALIGTPHLVRQCAGLKGGLKSRRGKIKIKREA